jgi:PAS domain S-box-containing protein
MKYLSSAKDVTVTFRWLIILLLLLFILFPPQSIGVTAYYWLAILFLVLFISNTVLSFVHEQPFIKHKLNFFVFLVDVFLISATIYAIQGFDSDLFLIYFIIIFIATLSSTGLKRSLIIGLIAAILYFGFYLRNHPFSALLTSYMLLRVPFFFLLAFISTYNSEQLKSEVTRRQRAEEKTERVLEQYKTLVHTIPDIIYELDAKGQFTFLSDSIRQLGFTADELLGKHFSAIIHPQDRDLVRRDLVLEKFKGNGGRDVPPPKLFDERRTGNRMTKNLGLRLILNQPQAIEQPFIYAEVHSSGKWASDETGKEKTLLGTIGIIRDITESYYDKKAIQEKNEALEAVNTDLGAALQKTEKANEELKQAESQLLQSEKLAAIGQLAAGIAHEINNPLGYVSSNIGVLNTHVEQLTRMLNAAEDLNTAIAGKDEARIAAAARAVADLGRSLDAPYVLKEVDGLIRGSTDGLGRIKKIVKDLNTFSRKDEDARLPSDLNAIIDGILSILWNEMKYKAELKKEYGQVPILNCNPQQIGQVIFNMLLNAVQALDGQGVITIRTRAEDHRAIVEIADTGQGIPPDKLDKIFEPFYTSKPAGKGTGLGLSISLDIVRRHGGTIVVESALGKGTTFRITLPC